MKKIIMIMVLTIMCLMCSGCTINYSDGSKTVGNHESHFREWISPDGVHYWCDGYRLAPRYDNNGNLVIDK